MATAASVAIATNKNDKACPAMTDPFLVSKYSFLFSASAAVYYFFQGLKMAKRMTPSFNLLLKLEALTLHQEFFYQISVLVANTYLAFEL